MFANSFPIRAARGFLQRIDQAFGQDLRLQQVDRSLEALEMLRHVGGIEDVGVDNLLDGAAQAVVLQRDQDHSIPRMGKGILLFKPADEMGLARTGHPLHDGKDMLIAFALGVQLFEQGALVDDTIAAQVGDAAHGYMGCEKGRGRR